MYFIVTCKAVLSKLKRVFSLVVPVELKLVSYIPSSLKKECFFIYIIELCIILSLYSH